LDACLHRLAGIFEGDHGALRVTYYDAGDLKALVDALLAPGDGP
jgi:hypothetical protein